MRAAAVLRWYRLGALACCLWAPLLHAQRASVHFLSRAEARAALTQGEGAAYYERLQLAEMRAKTGLPLEHVTLAVARALVRESYGAAAQDFSPEEQAALRSTLEDLQPLLQAQAPLYARTPWSFIKLSASIEGGLPHTRADSIVLSDALVARITKAHARQAADKPSALWNLLVHEQTHVLQRHSPALFASLYTSAFGFRQVSLPVPPEWVRIRRVVNPDAPDADWLFASGTATQPRWLLPDILLDNIEHPRMPDDFSIVALSVQQQGGKWSYAEPVMPAAPQKLLDLQDFVRRFPLHDVLFHPNEIAAGLLAALLTGVGIEDPQHELWERTRVWARQALR